MIAAYDRSALDQTGSGHFSPIGGYFDAKDMVLVLDVARFKYPPHWISAERLWKAMLPIDPTTGRSRGWIYLRRRAQGVSLGFTLSCEGDDLKGFARRLSATVEQLGSGARIEEFATALLPVATHLTVRVPSSNAHEEAIGAARDAVRKLSLFTRVEQAVGVERAEAVTLLLIAIADRLAPARRDELLAPPTDASTDGPLAAEIANLRDQLAALWTITEDQRRRAPPTGTALTRSRSAHHRGRDVEHCMGVDALGIEQPLVPAHEAGSRITPSCRDHISTDRDQNSAWAAA